MARPLLTRPGSLDRVPGSAPTGPSVPIEEFKEYSNAQVTGWLEAHAIAVRDVGLIRESGMTGNDLLEADAALLIGCGISSSGAVRITKAVGAVKNPGAATDTAGRPTKELKSQNTLFLNDLGTWMQDREKLDTVLEAEEDAKKKKKVTKKGNKKKTVFGMTLEEIYSQHPSAIPLVILQCIRYFKKSGALKQQGIFRVSGEQRKVNDLVLMYDVPSKMVDLEEIVENPHVVASLFKKFFRDLPDSLVCAAQADELFKLFRNEAFIIESDETLEKVSDIIASLPPLNGVLLRLLCEFFNKITIYQHLNMMTAENLGIVIGPSIIRPSSTDPAVLTLQLESKIACYCIKNYAEIFSEVGEGVRTSTGKGGSLIKKGGRRRSIFGGGRKDHHADQSTVSTPQQPAEPQGLEEFADWLIQKNGTSAARSMVDKSHGDEDGLAAAQSLGGAGNDNELEEEEAAKEEAVEDISVAVALHNKRLGMGMGPPVAYNEELAMRLRKQAEGAPAPAPRPVPAVRQPRPVGAAPPSYGRRRSVPNVPSYNPQFEIPPPVQSLPPTLGAVPMVPPVPNAPAPDSTSPRPAPRKGSQIQTRPPSSHDAVANNRAASVAGVVRNRPPQRPLSAVGAPQIPPPSQNRPPPRSVGGAPPPVTRPPRPASSHHDAPPSLSAPVHSPGTVPLPHQGSSPRQDVVPTPHSPRILPVPGGISPQAAPQKPRRMSMHAPHQPPIAGERQVTGSLPPSTIQPPMATGRRMSNSGRELPSMPPPSLPSPIAAEKKDASLPPPIAQPPNYMPPPPN